MKKLFIGLLSLLNLRSMAQVYKETFVEESGFIIYDNVQSKYKGIYRDGKSYNGYFKTEYQAYEMILVDYYEQGVLKCQYSKHFDVENYTDEEIKTLDTKSIYKNDVIFNGIEYAFINKGLVCKIWKEGILESFTVHMFAMHYYNRLVVERKDSTIRIINMLEEGDELKYIYINGSVITELNSAEFIMRRNKYTPIDLLNVPVSSLAFYIQYKDLMILKAQKLNNQERQQFFVNIQIYENLKVPESGNAYDAFKNLGTYFSTRESLNQIFEYEENSQTDVEEPSPDYIVGILSTDADGKVINGIRWVDATQPFYEEYLNGQVVKKEHSDIQNFQHIADAFYKSITEMSHDDVSDE